VICLCIGGFSFEKNAMVNNVSLIQKDVSLGKVDTDFNEIVNEVNNIIYEKTLRSSVVKGKASQEIYYIFNL